MPTKCSLPAASSRSSAVTRAAAPGPRRRSRRAASGFASDAEAADIATSRASSPSRAPTSAASRAGAHLVVLDDDRGARLRHPGGVGGLVVGGRVRIGDEDRRPAGRGDLEDRAARAAEHQVAGGEAVAEVRLVGEQRVAVAVRGRARAARAAPRSRGARRGGRRGSRGPRARRSASIAHSLIERAPWLPPITSRQRRPAAIAEALAGRVAVGGEHRRRDRPAGDQVPLPLAAGDREGEADPPRPPGEQAVGEAEVAVGLGEDERRPRRAAPPGRPARRRSRRRP